MMDSQKPIKYTRSTCVKKVKYFMYIQLPYTNYHTYLYSSSIAAHKGISLMKAIPWPVAKITFGHHHLT